MNNTTAQQLCEPPFTMGFLRWLLRNYDEDMEVVGITVSPSGVTLTFMGNDGCIQAEHLCGFTTPEPEGKEVKWEK